MHRSLAHRFIAVPFATALLLTCGIPGWGQQKADRKPDKQSQKPRPPAPASTSTTASPADKPSLLLPVLGSGTTNFIPVWTTSYAIGNSILSQSGGTLNVSGNVSARSFTGNGSTLTGVNASALSGLSSSAFAQLGVANTFSVSQTISGNLNLTGSLNESLILQGNLVDAAGDQSANIIGGFTGSPGFQGNSVSAGVLGATIAGGGGAVASSSLPAHKLRKGAKNRFGIPVTTVPNFVLSNWGTVGGGLGNSAGGFASTVAGGDQNSASGSEATIAGGSQNIASADDSSVGGGLVNTSSGAGGSTVGGGELNEASGEMATVGGGNQNGASGDFSTVAGGSGNFAIGRYSMVPGGSINVAAGYGSLAAGTKAAANYDGSFVWSDSNLSLSIFPVQDFAPNQFVARASGGFTFYTAADMSTGVALASGSGSWSSLSDRKVKANLAAIDTGSVLAKIAALPIFSWNYKTQSADVRHLGPMAQDFREAFGLGEDERHISTVDSEGVALAAIQGLLKLDREKDEKIAELSQVVDEKARELGELRAQVERLARVVAANH